MPEWKAKRFWKSTAVTEDRDGYGIALDHRPVRTPNKNHLIVPTWAMAQAIAAEWDAQGEDIDPLSMPVTRGANSAIERLHPNARPSFWVLPNTATVTFCATVLLGRKDLLRNKGPLGIRFWIGLRRH